MDFFQHPLLKQNALERRLYQETILGTCNNINSLIILPTGLGKTIIALLIAVSRLNKYSNSKIIFCAPTKPLVSQHYHTFKSVLVSDEGLEMLTGSIAPEKRGALFTDAKILFYTPQTLQNDIITGIAKLADVSLIIFDEAHRAVGEYAYNFIADQYVKTANHPLILGMTASPGATREKIDAVLENLFIKNIEIRTEKSPDVINYVQPIEMKWQRIELPLEFREIKQLIESKYKDILKYLKTYNYLDSYDISRVTKQNLLSAQTRIRKALTASSSPTADDYELVANAAMAIRFSYMLELLGTQGLNSLLSYLEKIIKTASGKRSSRVLRELVQSPFFIELKNKVSLLLEKGMDHPKYGALQKYLQNQFKKNKTSRVIVFTQYRVTAQLVTDKLEEIGDLKPIRFVGQQSKPGDKGLGQKRQLEILEQFKEGIYNVLVATSVAEEGLDIAECDLVIFYDVVPSEIRYVQRKGRTGRKRPGEVFILMARGTRDEGYYWAAQRKQREMYRILNDLQELARKKYRRIDSGQTQIEKFVPKKKVDFEIIVDHRESSSSLVKDLVTEGFKIKLAQLPVADYRLGTRVLIERKTCQDFSKSIIDGRLFKEIKELKQNSTHSLLLIEGEDLYTVSTLKPEAIRAACVSIMLDFNIPIIFTKDGKESARFFRTIARREMEKEKGKKVVPTRFEKAPQKTSEIQEFVVAGLPGIDTIRARKLLHKLKTIENVFTAEEEELQDVEGIGKKLAERIRKIIGAKYKP
ncbi:MAG: DEAD/DEAH box helicase family protein [Candidatus Helarchaeota archaeon]|nr:DEAD/DEAH box helicase family protein [Candidatus Helarchaeota archaeon]